MITRIITGIVGIALATLVIQTGGWVFAACSLLLALVAWYEYSRAVGCRGISTAYISGILALALFMGCAWLGSADEFLAVLTGTVLWVLLLMVFLGSQFTVKDAGASVAGICYTGLSFAHIVMLRFLPADELLKTPLGDMERGCAFIWIMFICTWASDTFAYFTGSAIGSHKLCPSISPKKTVEGFLGGLFGTAATAAGLGVFFGFSVYEMAALGAVIAIIATLGDLVESVIKRYAGIKDSGSLIPGHGGVLDRFDSAMFTAPFVYYFVQVMDVIKSLG